MGWDGMGWFLVPGSRHFSYERKTAMKGTQPSAKTTGETDKKYDGFTDDERGAMKERAKEMKAAARRGSHAAKADAESEVLEKIAEMPETDRVLAERVHAIIKASAPDLASK